MTDYVYVPPDYLSPNARRMTVAELIRELQKYPADAVWTADESPKIFIESAPNRAPIGAIDNTVPR